MRHIINYSIALILVAPIMLLWAWASLVLWGWVMVPAFNLPPMSLSHALVLGLLVSSLNPQPLKWKKFKEKETGAEALGTIGLTCIRPLVLVGFAWVMLTLFGELP